MSDAIDSDSAVITKWPSLTSTKGTTICISWPKLFDELRRPARFQGDHEHPGWSPALITGAERKDANVKSIGALLLDYDAGTTIEAAHSLWSAHYGLIHTTRKHSADAHRFRIILPLSRQVSVDEHARLWKWAEQKAIDAQHKIDVSTKNPSRFWFLPGAVDVSAYETRTLSGDLLDVDAALADHDAKEQRSAPLISTQRKLNEPNDSIYRRARAYVSRMPSAISGQQGHAATFAVALVLVRGFRLSERDALELLEEYNQRCEPQWNERELQHKIDSASKARTAEGWLLENDKQDYAHFIPVYTSDFETAAEPSILLTPAWKSPAERARCLGSFGERLPTGLTTFDKATRGGIPAGKVIILAGAPGVGKTGCAVDLGVRWALRGLHTAIVASDEDADALLIRAGQILGLNREKLEDADPQMREQLARMLEEKLSNLMLVDADESVATVDAVSAELFRRAGGSPTILIVDSVQTCKVFGMENADGIRARTDMVMATLKREAKQRGHRVLATCEVARGAYRSQNAAERTDDLAAFKESGGIEYGATLALVLRSVPGDGGLIDVTMPKNRLGQKLPFRMSLNFTTAKFSEVEMPAEDAGADTALLKMKERVFQVVSKSILKPITSKNELARRVGGNKTRSNKAVDELLEEGRLTQVDGAFSIGSSGSKVVPGTGRPYAAVPVPRPIGAEPVRGTGRDAEDSYDE